MKISHRTPSANWFHVPPSAVVDADYEAEVQRSTARGEREYRRREQRLAKAEARLATARGENRKKVTRQHLAELVALVELRRAELDEYRRLMVGVPASAEHRGTRSYRPVPPVQGNPIP
jgi:hypothetical protein